MVPEAEEEGPSAYLARVRLDFYLREALRACALGGCSSGDSAEVALALFYCVFRSGEAVVECVDNVDIMLST